MSQQGADDWWQKLYETPDPDPAATPDPADTLDSRFHSVSSLTTRVPPQGPAGPGHVPAVPPGPPQGAPGPHGSTPPAVPPEWGAGAVAPVPPGPPHSAPGPVPPPVPPPSAPVPPPYAVLPGPRREAGPEPAPPRDPREPGTTGYGLGSVTVPPVLPEEPPDLPVWRWGAPPGQSPDGDSGTRTWPLPGRDPGPGTGTNSEAAAGPGHEPPPGSDPARDPRSGQEPPAPWDTPVTGTSGDRGTRSGAEPPAPWEVPGGGAGAAAEADPRPVAGPQPLADSQPRVGPQPPAASQPLVGAPVAGEPWSGAGNGSDAGPGGGQRPVTGFLGDRAPTYAAEPGALPLADPAALEELVPDTVLEGARHGAYTLRATSVRGDSARFRGETRRDFLLTARFGTGDDALVLVALAGGDRAAPGAAEAAAELCRWIASAVGRSRERLADDIRSGRRDALRSGLQRLTDRGYGRLRAHAAELGLPEEAYTAGLRVLLLPIDPECKTRVCFGSGAGGLFRLRGGAWEDLEPQQAEPAESGADGFRFRAAVARPRDTLLLCSGGLADPMREEGLLPAELAARWADREPPGLASFLADTQLRLKGYADDRTAAAVWEA
ncbi:protein phosphatase 2C domain-containing protein [Streptomyces sp. NPDC055796]